MNALIAKLVPFRDWLYAGVLVACIVFYNVHVHGLIKHATEQQRIAVQQASDQVKAAAAKEAAAMKDDYEAKLAKAQGDLDETRKSNAATHTADLAKLQQYADRLRDADRALQSAAGSGVQPGTGSGSGSADGVGQLPEFAIVSLGLADALRHDDALLASCRADRDALTGK